MKMRHALIMQSDPLTRVPSSMRGMDKAPTRDKTAGIATKPRS